MLQVAVPGKDERERQFVDNLLNGAYSAPDDVLKVLREYPQVCVLKLRVLNDEEKEEKGYMYAANK